MRFGANRLVEMVYSVHQSPQLMWMYLRIPGIWGLAQTGRTVLTAGGQDAEITEIGSSLSDVLSLGVTNTRVVLLDEDDNSLLSVGHRWQCIQHADRGIDI